jgi:hypothetical protein
VIGNQPEGLEYGLAAVDELREEGRNAPDERSGSAEKDAPNVACLARE